MATSQNGNGCAGNAFDSADEPFLVWASLSGAVRYLTSGEVPMHLCKPWPALIGLALIFQSACSLAPIAPPNATPAVPLKLKIADGVNPPAALPQSVLSLARQQGYFQREGLDAEIVDVNGTPAIITAMRS